MFTLQHGEVTEGKELLNVRSTPISRLLPIASRDINQVLVTSPSMLSFLQRGEPRETNIRLRWERQPERNIVDRVLRGATVTQVGSDVYLCKMRGHLSVFSCRTWSWTNYGHCLLGLGIWHVAELAEDKIYFFGGNGSNEVVEYDIVLKQAREVATYNESATARDFMVSGFASWRNDIVTFGGIVQEAGTLSNEMHALNVETLSWKRLELRGEQPEPRYFHSATMCEKKMYIYGGCDENRELLPDLWVADFANLRAPSWSKAQVNGNNVLGRTEAALNHLEGLIVVLGGYDDTDNIQRQLQIYSSASNRWHDQDSYGVEVTGAAPGESTFYHGVSTSDGILYFTHVGVYRLSVR